MYDRQYPSAEVEARRKSIFCKNFNEHKVREDGDKTMAFMSKDDPIYSKDADLLDVEYFDMYGVNRSTK